MATQQTKDTNEQRNQLVLDITSALRRRIERAAARGDLSAAEYAARLLERSVPEEEEDVEAEAPVPQPNPATTAYLDSLEAFQAEFRRKHPGVVFEDSGETVRKMREERSEYLNSL